MKNYSNVTQVVTVNGRRITQWGIAPNPYSAEDIDPRTTMRRGQGSSGIRMDTDDFGQRVTLSLEPGGTDSGYMSGLLKSKANITVTAQQIGTLEIAVGTNGAITAVGSTGRGGKTDVTDDVYIMEFITWNDAKGGE